MLGGRNLYNQLPGKNLATQQLLARLPDTPTNIEKMCFHIAKLAEIPDRNLTIMMQTPVVAAPPDTDAPATAKETSPPLNNDDLLLAFDPKESGYLESKKMAAALGLKPNSQKKDDIFKALADARKKLVDTKIAEMPQEVKASIKLRDQFPFLRAHDCPDSLKLLVADLITAYETFKAHQPRLHEMLGAKEMKAIVDIVKDNYISNKMAYDELEHYKKTKAILGKHPLFKRLALKEEISAMATPTLTKKIEALKVNVYRNKSKGNGDLLERDEDLLAHAENVLSKR